MPSPKAICWCCASIRRCMKYRIWLSGRFHDLCRACSKQVSGAFKVKDLKSSL